MYVEVTRKLKNKTKIGGMLDLGISFFPFYDNEFIQFKQISTNSSPKLKLTLNVRLLHKIIYKDALFYTQCLTLTLRYAFQYNTGISV